MGPQKAGKPAAYDEFLRRKSLRQNPCLPPQVVPPKAKPGTRTSSCSCWVILLLCMVGVFYLWYTKYSARRNRGTWFSTTTEAPKTANIIMLIALMVGVGLTLWYAEILTFSDEEEFVDLELGLKNMTGCSAETASYYRKKEIKNHFNNKAKQERNQILRRDSGFRGFDAFEKHIHRHRGARYTRKSL